ncbi:MAG: tyrosine-type recombinase/integrase [Phycisphaerae bacterium]|jgi:integrase
MALQINNPKGELVFDPYKQKERYQRSENILEGISDEDRKIILRMLNDFELGRNVNSTKGERSYTRLNTLKSRLKKISELLNSHYGKKLTTVTETELMLLFKRMKDGQIRKTDGKPYKAVADYIKIYKAFWHWHMKVMKKEDKRLSDITEDLTTKREKPKFNYFTFEQMKSMTEQAKYEYKVLMWFLFDSGIRAPTEFMNVKVKDLQEDGNTGNYQLNIRDETSKTFGRKIKLLLCSDMLRRYVKEKALSNEDFVFTTNPATVNKYLKRIGNRILGLNDLTLYDFRHSSACYWLPRYKSESALKWRFGWKQTEMIHYYTEFLGMKDTITQEDLVDAEEQKELEKELSKQKQLNRLTEERMKIQENKLMEVSEKFNKINMFMNLLAKNDPEVIEFLSKKAKKHGVHLD